jgi:DNA-binding transcriptional ArsR family regulator
MALFDPTRRLVFERILTVPRPVMAIAEGLPVSGPVVSQHLKALKAAGLINERRQGTRRLYVANPQALGELRATIEGMWRGHWRGWPRESTRNSTERHYASAMTAAGPR